MMNEKRNPLGWHETSAGESGSIGVRPDACPPDKGQGVRINIPLIPVYIEIRWRPLGPFRFSMRSLMLAVAIAGLFFSLWAYSVRLRTVGSYHAQQSVLATEIRSESPPYGLTPLVNWHVKMSHHYHDAASRIEWIMAISLLTLVAMGVVAVLVRVFQNVVPATSRSAPGMSTPPRPR